MSAPDTVPFPEISYDVQIRVLSKAHVTLVQTVALTRVDVDDPFSSLLPGDGTGPLRSHPSVLGRPLQYIETVLAAPVRPRLTTLLESPVEVKIKVLVLQQVYGVIPTLR